MTGEKCRTAAALLALALALAPAPAKAQRSWTMATSWGGGPLLEAAGRMADTVALLSNGALSVQAVPAGTIGEPLKVTAAVRDRAAEAGHSWAVYDSEVDKATVLLGNYSGGLDGQQMQQWLYEGGGLDLYRAYRLEKFNVVAFPCGILPAELGMHARKKIQGLKDFEGLRLRTAGVWAEIAAGLGVTVVKVSADQVFSALERDQLDAVEWAQASFNAALGFHKIAKYLIVPGIHQPSTVLECVINREVWEGLPEREQRLVEIAAKLTSLELYQQVSQRDALAYQRYAEAGNEIVTLDGEVQQKARELSRAWAEKIAVEQGGWFKKIWEHQKAFERLWAAAASYRTPPPLN